MKTEDLKKKLKPKAPLPQPTQKDFLSTGSTMLNMALTGKPNCGFLKGLYYFLVGDSQSGKTFLALTCLAEATLNPAFKEHRFIFDNGENGALMNMGKFFGQAMVDRLEPPCKKDDEPVFSETVEQFYYHLDDAVKDGRPFIYILDSMDVLSSEPEQDKFEEKREAFERGKSAAGSYGDGKAKINSQHLRQVLGALRKTGSILIIINQTRDNLGFGFEKKSRSGGHALTFYASVELWSNVAGKIKKTVKGTPRQIGTFCQVRVKKNRVNGKDRTITVPIYWSCGIDDVGSMVDYLVEEKHWGKKDKGDTIIAKDLDLEMSREKLIRHIQDNDMEKDVQEIVRDVWDEIEAACEVARKPRYE